MYIGCYSKSELLNFSAIHDLLDVAVSQIKKRNLSAANMR